MAGDVASLRPQIGRQVAHWLTATSRLLDLDAIASPAAWEELERGVGVTLRRSLADGVGDLEREAETLRRAFDAASTVEALEQVRNRLWDFRQRYVETEVLVDLYGDAVNTRTNPEVSALLRACDVIARRSMIHVLNPLGHLTPPVLTYIDKGLGASILRAGLRLWRGGGLSSIAAIKVVFHNLFQPTAVIHEAGHQVAHILGWNDELAVTLERGLAGAGSDLAAVWRQWASEIAADTFAFVHTGFAAVVGLADVLGGRPRDVFRFIDGDPHPVSYIRVLLGTTLCSRCYGAGPWDALAHSWVRDYPLDQERGWITDLLRRSAPLLPRIADLCLATPMRSFGGGPLTALVDPARVAPSALAALEFDAGKALFVSPHWLWTECIRLLALTGLRLGTAPERATATLRDQQDWMARLGASVRAV